MIDATNNALALTTLPTSVMKRIHCPCNSERQQRVKTREVFVERLALKNELHSCKHEISGSVKNLERSALIGCQTLSRKQKTLFMWWWWWRRRSFVSLLKKLDPKLVQIKEPFMSQLCFQCIKIPPEKQWWTWQVARPSEKWKQSSKSEKLEWEICRALVVEATLDDSHLRTQNGGQRSRRRRSERGGVDDREEN